MRPCSATSPPGSTAMTAKASALALALVWGGGAALAVCTKTEYHDQSFTYCETGIADDLRLFLNDGDGQVLGNFRNIDAALRDEGKQLGFAMNAGMYHRDRSPVGLYIEGGETLSRIVTSYGPGNFGMLPNGVFCIEAAQYRVIESRSFAEDPPACLYAAQSGPMLVIEGEYHPRFIVESDSRLIRNGVGVSADGLRAVFVITDTPVNFHEFARFFREYLGLDQALYFDGNVSRLHAPNLRRSDWGPLLGPILGKVVDLE